MQKPSIQIKMIAEELNRKNFDNFETNEIAVIIGAIIRHLDIEYVVQQGKENKNIQSDLQSKKRINSTNSGNVSKNQKGKTRG